MLDTLDGVLFTGGFLNLRKIEDAPIEAKVFYKTAAGIFKYAINEMLPILGVCQGF